VTGRDEASRQVEWQMVAAYRQVTATETLAHQTGFSLIRVC